MRIQAIAPRFFILKSRHVKPISTLSSQPSPAMPGIPMKRLCALLALVPHVAFCADWIISNRVEIEHGTLRVDHTKSVNEITRAQAQGGFPAAHGLGLFQNRISKELVFEAPEKALETRHLSLTTRIVTAPVIYVAREFPEETCAYRLILDHELLHQYFDLEVLRAMQKEIQGITRVVFSPDALDWARPLDLDRARKRFFQQYDHVYESRSFHRHQRIDNPESYRRLSGLCNGEVTRLLAGKPR